MRGKFSSFCSIGEPPMPPSYLQNLNLELSFRRQEESTRFLMQKLRFRTIVRNDSFLHVFVYIATPLRGSQKLQKKFRGANAPNPKTAKQP
ncbi:MAG: hypothetical protein NW226_13260 [Microscillaceae bacterium]|nr:hypothetical protein [Microscillaceae bacterium]